MTVSLPNPVVPGAMTAQEIFTKVVTHLRKQGKPAMGGFDGGCRYRTDEGLSCAVGCLIPDGHPAIAWDFRGGDGDTTVNNLLPNFPDLGVLFGGPEVNEYVHGILRRRRHAYLLLRELQAAHDEQLSIPAWQANLEEEFIRLAKFYGLTIPEKE